MTDRLRPPPIRPTIPPGVVPGERRLTWDQILGKPATIPAAGITIALSDIPGQTSATPKYLRSKGTGTAAGTPAWQAPLGTEVFGDVSATRKFLKSVGTGAAAQACSWDTLTAADVGAGTFPGAVTFGAGATVAGGQTLTLTGATVAGAPTWSNGQTFPSLTVSGTSTLDGDVTIAEATDVILTLNSNATGRQWQVKSNTAGKYVVRDNTAPFNHLTIDPGAGTFTIATTTTVLSGVLRLGNSFTAGAPAATGYVTVQDSLGTTYKVLVGT